MLQASLRGGLFHEQEPNIVRNMYKIKLYPLRGLSKIQVQAYPTFWSRMLPFSQNPNIISFYPISHHPTLYKLLCRRKQVRPCGDLGEKAAIARELRHARRVIGKIILDPNMVIFETKTVHFIAPNRSFCKMERCNSHAICSP